MGIGQYKQRSDHHILARQNLYKNYYLKVHEEKHLIIVGNMNVKKVKVYPVPRWFFVY
jgi:hypothetical protein